MITETAGYSRELVKQTLSLAEYTSLAIFKLFIRALFTYLLYCKVYSANWQFLLGNGGKKP